MVRAAQHTRLASPPRSAAQDELNESSASPHAYALDVKRRHSKNGVRRVWEPERRPQYVRWQARSRSKTHTHRAPRPTLRAMPAIRCGVLEPRAKRFRAEAIR